MTEPYKAAYHRVTVDHDATDGLVELTAIERYGQDRKTKLKNNIIGQHTTSDSSHLLKVAQLLNRNLPPKTDREVIVGLMTSGVVLCSYLALVRSSKFTYSVYDKYQHQDQALQFNEAHRNNTTHYLYGVQPDAEIIIVEDEVTSGNGVIALHEAICDFGACTKAIACVTETHNFNARAKIHAATNLSLISLVRVTLSSYGCRPGWRYLNVLE